MKLAIVNITSGNMSGGYLTYLENMLPRLSYFNVIEKILCISHESVGLSSKVPRSEKIIHKTCKKFSFFSGRPEMNVRHQLDVFSPDLIFVPVERKFCYNSLPTVYMLQNMEPFIGSIPGNSFKETLKIMLLRFGGKQALKQADRILCISKFVREWLINDLNIPESKLELVYHGLVKESNQVEKMPKDIPRKLQNNFFFTAGSIRPARGLEDVILSMALLKNEFGTEPHLVIAGEITPSLQWYKNKLIRIIDSNRLKACVVWLGKLDKCEMNWCYNHCMAFIMSSRVESFGIIAGEAMINGCVCISAKNSSLPEVFGDSALYYEPQNFLDLKDKIIDVYDMDTATKDALSNRAKLQAARFSWDICAHRTINQFKTALASR